MVSASLQKLNSDYGEWVAADAVYHVHEPHLLSQAAGYLKFGLSARGPVLYRGESKLYKSLLPSLYRKGITSTRGRNNRLLAFQSFLAEARQVSAFLNGTPEYAHEPLLQHYGIRTRWLDLVDNVWVALWFACHQSYSTGHLGEYLHFRRRVHQNAGTPEYAYIVLVQTGQIAPVSGSPGLQAGEESEMIDLRVAAPSVYLRPHAQHGVLVKKKKNNDYTAEDMLPLVAGVLRIHLIDALSWLGNGDMLSAHTLFPPPHFDFGYRRILEKAPRGNSQLGSIHYIGA